MFLLKFSRVFGIEYDFISDVTKNWKVSHKFLERNNWLGSLNNVSRGMADIGICSVWMLHETYKIVDFSSYFDFQCATFLVPRPTRKDNAAFIYLSMRPTTWGSFFLSFFLTWLLLFYISKVCSRFGLYPQNMLKYIQPSRAFLDLVNTVTTHGLVSFPKPRPIRILLSR